MVWLRYERLIKQRYRMPNSSHGSVTFKEFVQLILDPPTKQPFNEHWKPYHEQCLPCEVRYDFIGHFETLQQDINYVLHKIGLNVTLLHVNPSNRHERNSTTYPHIVAKQMATLSHDEIRKLGGVYWRDFKLFGYLTERILPRYAMHPRY